MKPMSKKDAEDYVVTPEVEVLEATEDWKAQHPETHPQVLVNRSRPSRDFKVSFPWPAIQKVLNAALIVLSVIQFYSWGLSAPWHDYFTNIVQFFLILPLAIAVIIDKYLFEAIFYLTLVSAFRYWVAGLMRVEHDQPKESCALAAAGIVVLVVCLLPFGPQYGLGPVHYIAGTILLGYLSALGA